MEETTRNWADTTEEEHTTEDCLRRHDEQGSEAREGDRRQGSMALQEVGVWEVVLVAECMKKTHKKPIRERWVDVNKSDDQVEVYRSKYVFCVIQLGTSSVPLL